MTLVPTAKVPRPRKAPRDASGRGKMRAYRARMQAAGMRQVQIWVPDVKAPEVRKEARRQSRLVSRHGTEAEAIELVEDLADFEGWR